MDKPSCLSLLRGAPTGASELITRLSGCYLPYPEGGDIVGRPQGPLHLKVPSLPQLWISLSLPCLSPRRDTLWETPSDFVCCPIGCPSFILGSGRCPTLKQSIRGVHCVCYEDREEDSRRAAETLLTIFSLHPLLLYRINHA